MSRLLLAALFAAIVAACATETEGPPAISIQESWQSARNAPGHVAHLQKGLTCGECHDLSQPTIGEVDPSLCRGCHTQPLHHGAGETATDCIRCHQFQGQDAKVKLGNAELQPAFHQPGDCLTCHKDPKGDHPAVLVHNTEACLSCHSPHGERGVAPTDCSSCHEAIDLHHGRRSAEERPTAAQCLDCHQAHSPKEIARAACAECHQGIRGQTLGAPPIADSATFEGGHQDCSSCHNRNESHDLRASAASSCTDCHTDHSALSAEKIPQHNLCQNCHSPHDVKGSAPTACAGCHSEQKTDHPAAPGDGSACITCHAAHPQSGAAKSLGHGLGKACSSCHSEPSREKGHGGASLDCTTCHEPHSFVKSVQSQALCTDCHDKEVHQTQQNQGHAECGACHQDLPHHPTTGGVACASCHLEQKAATTRHDACTTCHQPHDGTQVAACKDCHTQQSAQSHRGHQDCQSCHDPHSASPQTPTQACGSCHEKESKKNPHSQLQANCSTCHQPHGPAHQKGGPPGPSRVPACTTCHQPPTLPSLHQNHQGTLCTSCHQPHDHAIKRNRADCLSCHQEQKDHQPQAQNCASCHMFRPASRP